MESSSQQATQFNLKNVLMYIINEILLILWCGSGNQGLVYIFVKAFDREKCAFPPFKGIGFEYNALRGRLTN